MKMNLKHQKMLLASALAFATASHAAYISEYFNGYGDTQIQLETVADGGGSGWAGEWTRPGAGDSTMYSDYIPNSIVAPSVTGYSSTGNLSGTSDGAAGAANIADSRYLLHRDNGALTGDIWMSAAYRTSGFSNDGFTKFQFDSDDFFSNDNYVALYNSPNDSNEGDIVYNGTNTAIDRDIFNPTNGVDYLLMVRIEMDYNVSGHDRMSVWVDIDDVTSIGALGTPYFVGEDADVFGASMDFFGLHVNGGSRADALRISNESDGFEFVTTGVAIPEPGTLALVGIALGTLVFFRRRR